MSRGLYGHIGFRCATEMHGFVDPDLGLGAKRRALAIMMGISQRFHKTDPKDSIYAILGLVHRDDRESNEEAALLRIDYSKSLADVLRDATCYALSQTNDLSVFRVLNHSHDQSECKSFTSWAVRADTLRHPKSLSLLSRLFHASQGLESPTRFLDTSKGPNILSYEGIDVDYVAELTETCEGYLWYKHEGYHPWLRSAKQLLDKSRYVLVEKDVSLAHQAMAFTLTAGEAYNRKRACRKDLLGLIEYIDSLTIRGDSPFGDKIGEQALLCYKAAMKKMYHVSLVTFCLQRRFFVTHGGLLGLGPCLMETGDRIVVLRGGDTPFILRQVDGLHKLLGAAYVYDIMDGEAVRDASVLVEGGKPEQIFHIR